MAYIIVRSDLVILNSIKGNYEVGIYSVAAALASKMLILTSPISNILAPRTIKEAEAQVEFILKVSRTLVFAMSLLLLIVDILYYPAVYVLYGKEFTKSMVPFLILNPGILFLSLSNTVYPYILSRGLPKISIIAPFSAATANIFLNIILIPYFGYNAAAFSSSLSYLIYYSLILRYFLKNERKKLRDAILPEKQEIAELLTRIAAKIRTLSR
jgi:O-antigen/teichoic acid export membrane protein